MSGDTLDALLRGTLPDPDGGPPLAVPTRAVVIADTLAGDEADLVAGLEMGNRLAVVSDSNTRQVLGARVTAALRSIAKITEVRLPGRPYADDATVEAIRRETKTCDALVAVGSGTINDLCKYAAALDGKDYAVFATAPSMNGYSSVSAAITVDGHKKSLPAVAAAGVFLDLEVLSQAPPRLIRSGLGDSLCRPTAQADWLLSHLLLDRPYRTAPFVLLKEDEEPLFADASALMEGDLEAMRRLACTLVLSGFGMTICGGSFPASQGEHLISHYAEMMGKPDWPESFHGEQIGVATLTMARLQEHLLSNDPPRIHPSRVTEESVKKHFGERLGSACWQELEGKRLDETAAAAYNARLEADWEDIRARLAAVTRPASALAAVLEEAGAPTTPEALGWPAPFYRDAVRHAREIRNRFTFLDLAADCGLFEDSDFLLNINEKRDSA